MSLVILNISFKISDAAPITVEFSSELTGIISTTLAKTEKALFPQLFSSVHK